MALKLWYVDLVFRITLMILSNRFPSVALLWGFFFVTNVLGQPLVQIETVLIGDGRNAPDDTGFGSVGHHFRIGKYEVTIGQYAAFLNSVASNDVHVLYDELMGSELNVAGIERLGSPGAYFYRAMVPAGDNPIRARSASNRPIAHITWFRAARFANWMHNGATNGADTEDGAYNLKRWGDREYAAPRNPDARWWIPTENEWYKAAYYKGGGTNAGYWDYATQSDAAPGNFIGNIPNHANYVGRTWSVTQSTIYSELQNYLTDVGAFSNSPSAYGTFDQAGNLAEWNDLGGDLSMFRGIRDGAWCNGVGLAQSSKRDTLRPVIFDTIGVGFRLATLATNAIPLPRIISTAFTNDSFTMTWSPVSTVNVQRCASLAEDSWSTVVSNVTNGTFTDSQPPSGKAFYRLSLP